MPVYLNKDVRLETQKPPKPTVVCWMNALRQKYEFDATTGHLTGSIKVSGAPTNITVEPANEQ
jgi:hypothetical protein